MCYNYAVELNGRLGQLYNTVLQTTANHGQQRYPINTNLTWPNLQYPTKTPIDYYSFYNTF